MQRMLALWIALLCGLVLGCSGPSTEESATPSPAPVSSLELFEETLTLEDGSELPYQRGLLTAPLHRDTPEGGTVEVEFFRFARQAEASPDTPPLFLLHGGPGFEGLGPRLENPGYFEARLARYTQLTDVVVPGQRGFGASGATPCDPIESLDLATALDPEKLQQARHSAMQTCQEHWRAQGLDLTGLHVVAAAADVVDIARLLGYDQIQLRGVSFGSHWGMTVLHNHPERVARATLSGLEGPDHTYDSPSGVLAALRRIAASAEASPALADRIPEGGLLEAFQTLAEQADQEPIAVEIVHPETEEPLTVTVDGTVLRRLLTGSRRYTQFRYRMVDWPLLLLEALEGNLQQAAELYLWNLLDGDLNDAAYFQYDCGSGLSAARREVFLQDPATALLGPLWQGLEADCAVWDADLGEGFRQAFTTSVPTVLVQGNWDTATPYENAEELRSYFSNHHFVRVEGGSHGAIREAIEGTEGFEAAMNQWIATGSMEQIPERVELPPYPWVASRDDS